jgi:hypothetical protein
MSYYRKWDNLIIQKELVDQTCHMKERKQYCWTHNSWVLQTKSSKSQNKKKLPWFSANMYTNMYTKAPLYFGQLETMWNVECKVIYRQK